jgi:hypothetical protein
MTTHTKIGTLGRYITFLGVLAVGVFVGLATRKLSFHKSQHATAASIPVDLAR